MPIMERRVGMRKVEIGKISSFFTWMAVLGMIGIAAFVINPAVAYSQGLKALVDLNKASEKELKDLKGVGPATAKKIIEGRPYKSVDDLSKAGVSAKTIEALKPFVTVGPATPAAKASGLAETAPAKVTQPAEKAKAAAEKGKAAAEKTKAAVKLAPGQKININTATKAELDALPGIGSAKAQAIIDGRPYQKIEDIMKVKGIKEGTFKKIKDYIIVK
jgi:competence protein ComEA